MDAARLLAHVHGHLGWLAVAALVHPAVLLRDPRRRATLAVWLAPGLATCAAALGFVAYGPFRARVRRPLFAEAEAWGWMFERKEHLAFGALAFAWTGALAYAAAAGAPAESPTRRTLRRVAWHGFVAASALGVAAATLATAVAAVRGL